MKYVLAYLLVGVSLIATGQNETGFNFDGVEMGESLEDVSSKLRTKAGKLYKVEVEHPSFPLSQNSEVHLICMECQSTGGKVEEVAFTFSDNQLKLIQAKGGAVQALVDIRKDTADVFMQYAVYWEDLIIADTKNDKVWIMSPDAAHPNLYAWDNPYLPSHGGREVTYRSSAEVPAFIEMGGTLEKLQPLLESASRFTFTRELPPGDPNAQLQIDCFGIEYAGFPRKFEARFGDRKLNMVWILTGKGEEDRIRNKLITSFGNPIFKNEAWEVFEDWQVFLRKDKPEVLLLTPELGAQYKKDYFKK